MIFEDMNAMENSDISSNFIKLLEEMERLPKQKRYKLMVHLYERYADANFGNGDTDVITDLPRAQKCRWLADLLADSLGFCSGFDHYTLEEIFVHPVEDGETVDSRMDALQKRCKIYFTDKDLLSSATMRVAREACQFFSLSRTKHKKFWEEVSLRLHQKLLV